MGDREKLRDQIVDRAERDAGVTACALVGSAARGEDDSWSDIDMALQLATAATVADAAEDWTTWLRTVANVADTLDPHASGAGYRVLVLDDSMQVDLVLLAA